MEIVFRKFVLVSAAACTSWLVAQFLVRALPQFPPFGLQVGLFALFVAGSVAATESFYELDRIDALDVIASALIGAIIGLLVGVALTAMREHLAATNQIVALLAFYLPWLFIGTFVGLAASLRVARMSRERLVNGLLGGLMGGTAGALLMFATSPLSLQDGIRDIVSAGSWATVGGAVAIGVSLAPGITSRARLVFESSRAAGARSKLGRKGSIELGTETICLGSRPLLAGQAQVLLIPDPEVHPVHCYLVHNEGHYEVHYSADNMPESSDHRAVLMNDRRLPHQSRLRDGARMTIGSTSFTFETRREAAS